MNGVFKNRLVCPSSPECPVAPPATLCVALRAGCHRDEWRSWLRRVSQRLDLRSQSCSGEASGPAACRGVLHGLILASLSLFGTGTVWAAVNIHDFSRYQVILDKKPFGEITPSEDTPSQTALSDVIAKDIEMKAMVDDVSGIRIGFLDKKTNKIFYLGLNEFHEGLQLISVDYDNEEAVLKKEGETAVIKLRPDKNATNVPPAMPAITGPAAISEMPFQPPVSAPSTTRRPFFSDLTKRKANPFLAAGTNLSPFQARPMDSFFKVTTGTFPRVQSPFRPFQVPQGAQGGSIPGVFQQVMTPVSNVSNPFVPVSSPGAQASPSSFNMPANTKGATIDQLLQQQPGGEVQTQPVMMQVPDDGEMPAEENP